MEVILSQDVKDIGRLGEVIKVKDGFARNFLFPRKLAFPATQQNLKRIEQQKKNAQAQYANEKQAAEEIASKLAKVSCTINVEVNDLDKLYGAITETDVIQALKAEGHTVERKQIVFEKPIEEVGIFEVGIKLHPEVLGKVRVWVTKK